MDKSFHNGYIIKNAFNMADENSKKIKVHVPDKNKSKNKKIVDESEVNFDLSQVNLKPKYSQEITLSIEKIKDLEFYIKYMEEPECNWWTEFVDRQKNLGQTSEENNEETEENEFEQEGTSENVDSLDRSLEFHNVRRLK